MRKKEPVETFAGDEGLSKYQIRKRQKMEKKARKNKRGEKIEGCLTIAEEPTKGSDGPESGKTKSNMHFVIIVCHSQPNLTTSPFLKQLKKVMLMSRTM